MAYAHLAESILSMSRTLDNGAAKETRRILIVTPTWPYLCAPNTPDLERSKFCRWAFTPGTSGVQEAAIAVSELEPGVPYDVRLSAGPIDRGGILASQLATLPMSQVSVHRASDARAST